MSSRAASHQLRLLARLSPGNGGPEVDAGNEFPNSRAGVDQEPVPLGSCEAGETTLVVRHGIPGPGHRCIGRGGSCVATGSNEQR